MLQIYMTIYTLHFNYDQQKIDDQISETSFFFFFFYENKFVQYTGHTGK